MWVIIWATNFETQVFIFYIRMLRKKIFLQPSFNFLKFYMTIFFCKVQFFAHYLSLPKYMQLKFVHHDLCVYIPQTTYQIPKNNLFLSLSKDKVHRYSIDVCFYYLSYSHCAFLSMNKKILKQQHLQNIFLLPLRHVQLLLWTRKTKHNTMAKTSPKQ